MTLLEQHTGGTDQALGYTHPSTGERFITGSVLMGENINWIKLSLKIGTGSPTGTIYWRIWNSSGTKLHDFGTSSASTIGADYSMIGANSPVQYTGTLAANDVIGAEYAGDGSNYLHQEQSTSSVYSYGNWTKKPATAPEQKTNDLVFTVSYGDPEPSSAGTRLPPPPIVLGGL